MKYTDLVIKTKPDRDKYTFNIPPVSENAEFPIIFLLIFLPSYLNQQDLPHGLFDSGTYQGQIILHSLLIYFLVRYLLQKKAPPAFPGLTAMSSRIRLVEILVCLGGLAFLFALYSLLVMPLLADLNLIGISEEPVLLTDRMMLFPALITTFTAALMEEFFFRGYAFFRIIQWGTGKIPALITANIIFAAGHLYEGFPAAVFALVSGIFLSVLVLKKISLYSLSVAHGIFNFTMILISYLKQLS